MNDFYRRLITGIVGVGLVIPALILSPYGLWFFAMVVSIVSLYEYYQGMGIQEGHYKWPALAIGLIFWAMVILQDLMSLPEHTLLYLVVAILPVLQIITLYDSSEKRPVERVSTILMGYVYVILPFFLMYQIGAKLYTPYNFYLPLGILVLTWTLDVMAYIFGRFLGGPLLFERVSPKKTWSGAIGGAVSCLIVGLLMQYFIGGFDWWIVAIILSVTSQLGDLIESMFKRSVKLKDSGTVLPGHGGMLDRFDGLFTALPFLYLYFLLA
ncbi:MAG: phosphatidate cytidylyltransferase [Bacteroidota bacterium]